MGRVLIAGCGYVGTTLAEILSGEGHEVFALRRRPRALPPGVRSIAADLLVPPTLADLPSGLDVVFYLAAPGGGDEAHYRATYVLGLRQLLDALAKQGTGPARVFFASSTAVYAQDDGAWVDEGSPTEPAGYRGRILLEAERTLLEGPFPGTVVRFGGIYGPRRTRLLERVRLGRAVYGSGRPHYTNRIHRDDCAGALRHLMGLRRVESLYLGVDGEPAAERDVLRWLAGALGAPPPRAVPDDSPELTRRAGSKRCKNRRLVKAGYAFRYPTFREGYTAVIAGEA